MASGSLSLSRVVTKAEASFAAKSSELTLTKSKSRISSFTGARVQKDKMFRVSKKESVDSNRRLVIKSVIADISQKQLISDTVAPSVDAAVIPMPRGNSWAVHKFGGTCVGTWERILNVAKIISSCPAQKTFVVVSAMSKVTDMLYRLIDLAEKKDAGYLQALEDVRVKHIETARNLLDEGSEDLEEFLVRLDEDVSNLSSMLKAIFIAGTATETFSDFIVGHGELWSATLLSATVRKINPAGCTFMDARDVLVVNPTLGTGNQVDPDYSASNNKLDLWHLNLVSSPDFKPFSNVVCTGFIARTSQGVPTTLKRDGSDFSASIFGNLLRASKVTIWTDVNGVYSADPRKVPEAVVLDSLSYQEAWEMSYFGANVLHPRTTLPVMQLDIPIVLRNAFNLEAKGTVITSKAAEERKEREERREEDQEAESRRIVKGFATIDNVALINVEGTGMAGVPGTASEIFTAVKEVGANVIAISQASSEHSVCFVVPEREALMVAKALEGKFKRALEAGNVHKIEVIHDCAVLAAVGQRMASTPGVSATLFSALAKAHVNVRAIAQGCSEYNITVVVNQSDSVRALKAAHARFHLSRTSIGIALVGPGLIGGTLLDQLRNQAAELREGFNIDLRVIGVLGLDGMLTSETGLDLSNWRSDLSSAKQDQVSSLARFSEHVLANHFLPNTVLVDCTASAEVASNYADWLRAGVHIVTPNKKANSGPLAKYLEIRGIQRKTYTHYFYETTVGAGLPIISTLKGLKETGDKFRKIDGIFSGTMSYLFNTFTADRKFSDVVKEAKASGYTEPDPRDDLAGMDVARKVVILAREVGLKLELEDVPIESMVPVELQDTSSAAEFLERLPEFDERMSERLREADQAGEVLRYVGVVDVEGGKGSVQLMRYPKSHPFAQLQGSDNIIQFTTERYHERQALIVRGPGAGAAVTAAGVFSDVLRLATYLGAPS